MEKDLDEKLEIDQLKIKNAVRLQLPIEITTYSLPRNMEIYIRKVLEMFLKECHQEHMFEYLNFCLGELLTNSKKANTKRVYFKEKNLDINNPEDYEIGMKNFKEDTLGNIDHYLNLQKKEGLYIKLLMQMKGEKIRVDIKNNAKITTFELERIQKKINSVQQYKTVEEVFLNVLDQSEGAGLGIIIIILMLQKIGLSKENFQVLATEDETITRIVLPCNSKLFAGTEILTYEFVKMQDSIPVLRNAYEEINKIVSQPTIDRNSLIQHIKTDATLTTLLLKNAVTKDSTDIDLLRTIKLLSDDDLRNIYCENNEGTVLIENSDDSEKLWEHSKNVAHFAYNFVKNFPNLQTTLSAEEAYTLGLLTNLGFIFLNNSSAEQKDYIKDLSSQFDDSSKIMDVFYLGNSSPHITMMYTKKIGFMETFSAILGCWNNNDLYPPAIKDASYIIYFAEILQFYKENVVDYYQIDKTILEKFNITNESQLNYLINALSA